MSAFNYSDVLIRLLYNGLTAFIIIRFVYFPVIADRNTCSPS